MLPSLAAGVFRCLSHAFLLLPIAQSLRPTDRGLPFSLGMGQMSIDLQMWSRTFLGIDRKLEDREWRVDRSGISRSGLSWSCPRRLLSGAIWALRRRPRHSRLTARREREKNLSFKYKSRKDPWLEESRLPQQQVPTPGGLCCTRLGLQLSGDYGVVLVYSAFGGFGSSWAKQSLEVT